MEVALETGAEIGGRFTLERQLGGGGTGAVWLASDGAGGDRVAIKFLHPWYARDPTAVAALAREADLLAKLDHPNIARLVWFGREQELICLALEHVPGSSLDVLIGAHGERREHMSALQIARTFEATCHAAIYAHLQGIVHRDLKPHHVLIRAPDQRVKVIDFGTARLTNQSPELASTVGRVYGSPAYMSPEQTRGDPATERSDVFALATILFEMLTLKRAWLWDGDRPVPAFVELTPAERAQNQSVQVMGRIAAAPRPMVSRERPGFAVLDAVLASALAIDPEERTPSVADLLEDVLPILESGAEDPIEEAPTEPL